MEELVDIVDRKGNPTGRKKFRSIVHKKGYFHRTIHIWVYNSKKNILSQKRAKQKATFAGLWEGSAAGHISAGQKPLQAAVRELYEEIGIKINKKDLVFIGIKEIEQKIPNKLFDHEIVFVYMLKLDVDIKKLKLQKEEVEAVKWISLSKFKSDIMDKIKYKKYVPNKKYYIDIIKLIGQI